MSLLPKMRTKYGEGIGVELYFQFPELFDDQRTYLDADVVAGASSISANGLNFFVGQYVIIGQPGNLKTEIIQIHSSTTPTGTLITFGATLSFAHSRGDVVRFIPYNQIIPTRSTDSGANFTPLSAISIRADSTETYLQRTGDASTDVYKFQFSNVSSGLVSAYSDQVTASGYGDNTVWSVKNRALSQLGEQRSDLITDQFLNDSLMEARRTLDQDPRILRWTFRTKFNTNIGQIVSAKWKVSAPTDLRDPNTFKNILSIRIGKQNRPCVYQDDNRFRQNYLNVAHTTLNGAVVSGATSITLTSSGDFDASGSCVVSGSGIGVLQDAFAYTANNRSTMVVSGVTGVPVAGYSTGSEVWQNATFGVPTAYTIDNGVLYFDIPFADSLDGQNIIMDYYKTLTAIDSDADTFDEPFYDLFVPWLKWKIKYLKANGKIDKTKDSDYMEWQEGCLRVIGQETNGQRINFIPDVDGFLSETG